ncbi:MAG: response regulator [Chloracidobacterium sp.]|nr:response regulator [Chloracidobacterium sp.]
MTPESVPPSKGNILIVEDDRFVRQAITHALRSKGYEVFSAADGCEALRRLAVTTTEVIVCDIAMPKHGRD